jgi:DNA-binding CsgD family transcriptional regulator
MSAQRCHSATLCRPATLGVSLWSVGPQRSVAFQGRTSERKKLDRLLDRAHGGESATLVIRGEPGVGKTALLRYTARQASGFRVAQIRGVESEMELPYAGLHQLCAPMSTQVDLLPEPQQMALSVAFGVSSGAPPDRFLIALATLSLLAQCGEERPLLCLVDDGQWLDSTSGQVLGFVARRLLADSVAIVVAVRDNGDDRPFAGLPELPLEGLPEEDARALLATVVPGRLDDDVRDRIIAETRGNPLALLELPRGMSAAELAGGFRLPHRGDVPGQIEGRYLQRIRALPEATQRLTLVAAADPVGDAALVWRASQTLGIEREAAEPAASEQLLEIGPRVQFRHPLVRSAIYRAASAEDRRTAHDALAAATDAETDPDRHAWHRAQATSGPHEEVATELERSAGRAQTRGGLAAAAAFLERSAKLTAEPERRVARMLAAAQVNLQAGAFDAALGLLAAAESDAPDELTNARVDLLRGRVVSAANAGSEAPLLLLKAAKQLEHLDLALARETYLDAWGAALFTGYLAKPGGSLLEVSRAARTAPPPTDRPAPSDLLLDGLATLVTEGRAAAAPTLRRAVTAFQSEAISTEKWLQWGVLAACAAVTLWDFESWCAISTRQVELARDAGGLALLSIALNGHGMIAAWSGELETAASLAARTRRSSKRRAPASHHTVPCCLPRGRWTEASALIEATSSDSVLRGEGLGVDLARWTTAILANGLGRYEEALAAAEPVSDEIPGVYISTWMLPERIEAAARSGKPQVAADALQRLTETAHAGDAGWACGIEARSRALLGEGEAAERLYREAIDRLSSTRVLTELARSHLLFGEWLRRENRRVDARQQLRTAHDLFTSMGADGFGDRARRELLATGERVRKRNVETRGELTPQEEHIARLARDGHTNPEIGAELYISARTVEWHLRNVFTKLGVTSRKGLQEALPLRHPDIAPA